MRRPDARRLRLTAICDGPLSRHGLRGPMIRFGWLLLQRLSDERIDLGIIYRTLRAWPGCIEQTIESLLRENVHAIRHCLRRDTKRA